MRASRNHGDERKGHDWVTLNVRATAYTGLGPGAHKVSVTGIERKVAKAGGDYFRWEFTDEQGNTASANTSATLTPGNKTGKWYANLTGEVVQVDGDYDLSRCIGKPADIFIELNPEGFPKVISVVGRLATVRNATPTAEAIAKAEHAKQEGDTDDLPF